MTPESCLLTNFIYNNNIVSTCDFIPDRLNRGKVIYEVLRVINGIPLFYKEHIQRCTGSLTNSGLKITLSTKSIALRIKALIESNKLEEGNIRFQISFAEGDETIFSAWVTPFFYPGKELYQTGASLSSIVGQRKNPNIKVYNPGLKNDISKRIRKNGIYEILLASTDGLITEGSRSNIFFVKDNSIYTPTTSSVLPGITRLKVIEIAKKSNVNCEELNINLNSLPLYDSAFITGTSPKVLPVKKIDDVFFNPKNITVKTFMKEYNTLVKKDIESFSWACNIK